jgi:nucleotide-binding universal stress UspA family protein
MEYKHILIGTDGSELMETVYEHCAYLARLTNATIHIAYVLDIAGFASIPIDSTWQNMYDVLLDEGKAITENAKKAVISQGIGKAAIMTAVLQGHPSDELNTYVENNAIDLIVIGTHGRTGLDRLLIGSVADKVIRGAKVPVLVVRSPTNI